VNVNVLVSFLLFPSFFVGSKNYLSIFRCFSSKAAWPLSHSAESSLDRSRNGNGSISKRRRRGKRGEEEEEDHELLSPEILEQIAAAENGGGGGGNPDRVRICPHCTFENADHSGPDCEVCGLPL